MDKILDHIDSKYRIITLVAKRSRQLARGEQPLVATKLLKPTSIALQEILDRKVGFEPGLEETEVEKERLEQARRRFTPPETYVPSLDFKHDKGLAPAVTEETEKEDLEEEEEEAIFEEVLVGEEGIEDEGEGEEEE